MLFAYITGGLPSVYASKNFTVEYAMNCPTRAWFSGIMSCVAMM